MPWIDFNCPKDLKPHMKFEMIGWHLARMAKFYGGACNGAYCARGSVSRAMAVGQLIIRSVNNPLWILLMVVLGVW